MPTNTPYIYCATANSPTAPVSQPIDTSTSCGTTSAVKTNYADIKKWLINGLKAKVTIDGYIYNATQRGTYYHEWSCKDQYIYAVPVTGPCPDDKKPRLYTGSCIVKGKYSYTPCASCDEGCNSSCDPGVGLMSGFFVPREAHDKLDFSFRVEAWTLAKDKNDPSGGTGFFWETPTAGITPGTCAPGGGSNSNAYQKSSNAYYQSFYTSNTELPGNLYVEDYTAKYDPDLANRVGFNGLGLNPCFDIPVVVNTEYGCSWAGFDCFGVNKDGYASNPGQIYGGSGANLGAGVWQLEDGKKWLYSSSWYWRNTLSKFPCGECAWGQPVKDCDSCERCHATDGCCGKYCTCGSCGEKTPCADPNGSCGDPTSDPPPPAYNQGGTKGGGCGGGQCGDHDVWQSGKMTIEVELVGYDPNRCKK